MFFKQLLFSDKYGYTLATAKTAISIAMMCWSVVYHVFSVEQLFRNNDSVVTCFVLRVGGQSSGATFAETVRYCGLWLHQL